MGTRGALDPTPPFQALSRAIQDAAGGPGATLFSLRSSDEAWQVSQPGRERNIAAPGPSGSSSSTQSTSSASQLTRNTTV